MVIKYQLYSLYSFVALGLMIFYLVGGYIRYQDERLEEFHYLMSLSIEQLMDIKVTKG